MISDTAEHAVGFATYLSSVTAQSESLSLDTTPNLIISDCIKLSDYIDDLSADNTGNEEKLYEADVVDCHSVVK